MQVNIHGIREQKGGQLPIEGEAKAPSLEVEGGEVPFSPVGVHGTVTNTGKGYLVQVTLSGEARLECTRCLAPFVLPVRWAMQEMYYPERLRGSVPEGEDVANYFSGDVIDLSEAIREHLQLAMPMKRVCRDDCRGLCPRCGHNLNQGPCACSLDDVDDRWAALRKLVGSEPSPGGRGGA